MEERVRGKGGGRREQQLMVVMRADEGIDCDNAVAGPVLDHDRLTPSLAEPIREQPRADIGAAARTQRQDEFHRPCRPGLIGGRAEVRKG